MRLTTYTDYTLRVLMYLALRPEHTATVAEIAEAYGISRMHLNKVVRELGQAGDIDTLRGRKGGIRLAKPADAINVADVVRRSEPDMELVPCFSSTRACVLGRCCLLHGALRRAGHAFMAELSRYTLADLVGSGGPTADVFQDQRVSDARTSRLRAPAARRRTPRPATRVAAKG